MLVVINLVDLYRLFDYILIYLWETGTKIKNIYYLFWEIVTEMFMYIDLCNLRNGDRINKTYFFRS